MVHHPRNRRRRWPLIVLTCLWLDWLALGIGVRVLSQRVEWVSMEAGPISQTLNHPPAPGQPAQQRVERYRLFGRGFYAEHAMVVTTLDFSRSGSRGNSDLLAWITAEDQLRSHLPIFGRDNLGPRIKISGWLPLQALAIVTILALIAAPVWRTVRDACQNRPVS